MAPSQPRRPQTPGVLAHLLCCPDAAGRNRCTLCLLRTGAREETSILFLGKGTPQASLSRDEGQPRAPALRYRWHSGEGSERALWGLSTARPGHRLQRNRSKQQKDCLAFLGIICRKRLCLRLSPESPSHCRNQPMTWHKQIHLDNNK